MIELIANSGIQFYKFDLKIDPNKDIIKTMGFWEKLDMEEQRVKLEHTTYLSEEDLWVSRKELAIEGYLNEDGSIAENVNYKVLTELKEKIDYFKISDIETPLECYENEWLPFPYFNNNEFGPTNWCRIKLIPLEKKHRRIKEYKVVLAFDTKTTKDREQQHTPLVNTEFSEFSLCDDIDKLLNFCDKKHSEEWIINYLAEVIKIKAEKGITNKIRIDDNNDDNYFELDYIGYYIFLVKYLQALEVCPPITLLSDEVAKPIDVDLVLDIGNSNTFGVLFEAPHQKDTFNFNAVKRLKLQDFTKVENKYDEPFSMRLTFHKCDFGEMGDKDGKFQWPSFVRVGKEAKRLIYDAHNAVKTDGNETVTNHSSPKRYLWDKEKSDIQWEIVLTGEDIGDNHNIDTSIYLQGITEQFTKDGSFTKSVDFGTQNQYSRKSLMTFVFMELLSHALVQINSPEFREFHGHSSVPRRLRRVVITCPTAMVQEEQITLRECAEEASIALQRYHTSTYREEYDPQNYSNKIEIIPSIRDLKRKTKDFSSRRDWIYDEATCCQLVFLYAEISKRYLNNCEQYFDLYGKYRSDLEEEDYDKKSLTIGSIDIGAGTTDLMINAYQYKDDGTAVLTPVPLYWESFTYAGDDLLKEIVRQVIIEGNIQNEEYRGCTGVVMNEAKTKGISNITGKLNKFFGTDSANISFKGKQIRRKFNTQISVPIAERYMEHTRLGDEDKIFTYDDFFSEYQPNQELLDYFEEHFGFKFQEIRWKLSAQRINDIVERFFEPFIKQLSVLLHTMKCDFVLLAGRPTSLDKIGELFLKFYPVSPDKIITLNDYRVGRWYPFQNGTGYFTNQKSIVAVGAAISMTGGSLDKLQGFRLNMDYVKKRLVSTAQYMGVYNRVGQRISNIFLSPDQNRDKFQVSSLPLMVGFKRLPAKTYRGRMIYLLDFNDKKIAEKRLNRYPNLSPEQLEREVDDFKIKLKNRMPFYIKISRDYRDDREMIHIDSITDSRREDISSRFFTLKLKTLDEDKGYWLDTGQFIL